MADADCCQTEIKETPKPAANVAEPDHSGAEAKAHEFNKEKEKAKADAAKDGKPVTDDGPKPTAISVPAAPKSQAKKGGATPAGKTAAKSGEVPAGKGKGGAGGKSAALGAAPAKGPAATAAAAAVDAEVQQFLEKAPHDDSKEAVHPQVKQLVQAAKTLQEKAPPIPAEKSMAGKAGAYLTEDFKKMAGPDQNPYADWDSDLKGKAQFVARSRDIIAATSSILGKIGLVLSIAGVIISITGIGAPLGAPIATIGRVLGLITLVLDVITAALSGYLVYLGGMQLGRPGLDPKKRAAIAKQIMAEADNTFQATMSVALAVPGVGKLAGAAAGGLKTIAKGIAIKLAKVLGKVGMAAVKGVVKFMAFAWKKGKAFFGVAEKAAVAGEKGVVSRALGAVGRGLERGAAYTMYGVRKSGEFVQGVGKKIADKVNPKLDAWLGKAEKKAVGKAAGKIGAFANKTTEAFEKYTGAKALGKLDNSIRYGFAKAGAKTDAQVAKLATSQAEQAAGKEVAESSEKQVAKSVEQNGVEHAEEAAVKSGGSEAAGEAEKDAASSAAKPAAKVGSAKDELSKLTEWGGDRWSRKDTIKAAEEQEAEKLRSEERRALREEADKRAEVRDLERDIDRKNVARRRLAKKGGDTSALDEELAADEKALGKREEAARKAVEETENIRGKMADARAGERANQRLNEARGGVDAQGHEAEGLSHTSRKRTREWEDSKSYKDPGKETMGGLWAEKVAEPQELPGSLKEAMDENQKKRNEEQSEEGRLIAEKAVARSEETEQKEESGDPPGAPGAAPQIAELQGGGTGEGVATRVHNLVGDIDHRPSPSAEQPDGQAPGSSSGAQNAPQGDEKTAAPGAPGNAEESSAQTEAATPKPTDTGEKGGAAEGAPAQPGAVPYWPGLLKEYDADLQDLDQTETALHAYRTAQISGYKRAVGIEDDAKKNKEDAKGRQPAQEHNITESKGDTAALTESSAQGKAASGHAAKGGAKKGEGAAGAQQGGEAAGVEVPDPPAAHWWNKLINLAKKYLVNYLAKGLMWIQDKFSNMILQQLVGVDLESMKKIADCRSEKAGTDAGATTKAAADTDASKAKDGHTEKKAEETESESKQLQTQTKENVKTADELLHAVGDLKRMILQEQKAGQQFLKDVTASKEREKQDEEAKEQQERASQEQQAGNKTGGQQETVNRASSQAGSPEKTTQADPFQVARIKQAAQLVIDAEATCYDRIAKGFASGKQTLSAGKGESKLDPSRIEAAAHAFDEAGQEVVSKHDESKKRRVDKMKSIVARDSFAPGEPIQVGGEIEEAASQTESDFAASVEEIKITFEACYKTGFTPASPARKNGDEGPAPAAP